MIPKAHLLYYSILQATHIVFLIFFLSDMDFILTLTGNEEAWNETLKGVFLWISIIDFAIAAVALMIVIKWKFSDKINTRLFYACVAGSVYSALIFGALIQHFGLNKGSEVLFFLFSLPFLGVFWLLWTHIKKSS